MHRIIQHLLIALSILGLFTCSKTPVNIPADARVIIVGAGAAGLNAGRVLNEKGVNFTIVEASDQVGGRLRKNTEFADFPLDVGAEWIHGNKALTYRWARREDVALYKDESDMVLWYGDRYLPVDDADFPECMSSDDLGQLVLKIKRDYPIISLA